jgi:hypothetical protein
MTNGVGRGSQADMRSRLIRATAFLTLLSALFCDRASALEIRFSGIITAATAGDYGVAVGDRFSGYLLYDLVAFPNSHGLGVAVIDIETATTSPDIQFYYPNSMLTAVDGAFYLMGNPYDFFGSLYLYVDPAGSPIGGELALISEPGRNHGSFRGVIDVPDTASTITLFVLGLIAIGYWRHASRVT